MVRNQGKSMNTLKSYIGNFIGYAFFIFFSIPTMIIIILIAILLPFEPRFKNENDCNWNAIDKDSTICDSLRKRNYGPYEYFNYKECYNEHYNMYLKEALREYANPPQLKGDILTMISYSRLGVLVWICLGIGTIVTFVRFLDDDEMWWWFMPDKKWLNRINYRDLIR